MLHARMKNLFAGLAVLIAVNVQSAPLPAPSLAEVQLRAINHRFVNAFAHADGAYMEALTASDFLLTSNQGEWVDRAGHLDQMRKPTIIGGVSYDDVRVRLFGSVALLHGLFEAVGAEGALLRVRYTDVYQWDGAHWRLVSAQNTTLREGVATQQQRGKAPAFPRWNGKVPRGNDHDVLLELNANYVRAFRESDVAWYGAHLADDYIVINGDGSFGDRASALAAFAEPTFQTHMRSFPVDKVRIRRFGDVALIHAENAYELKDGRKGVSRYTDIWHRQADGRWLCVAAHITQNKAPA